MRADNTKHLLLSAQQRSDHARRRAEQALEQLIANRQPLAVAGLARTAGVSRSWLYTQPDLLDQLQRRASDKTTLSTTATRASDASLQRRLELAHQRINQQADEITKLRTALARTRRPPCRHLPRPAKCRYLKCLRLGASRVKKSGI